MNLSGLFSLGRASPPTTAEEERLRLDSFYSRISQPINSPNAGQQRLWWAEATEQYIRMNWPISLATLNWLWGKLTNGQNEDKSTSSAKTPESHPLAEEAIGHLFDFDTSPVTYVNDPKLESQEKGYHHQQLRKPPGIIIQQSVFLEPLQTSGVHSAPLNANGDLDKFAMTIADLKQYDGVYCLSGVRGSGKSSVLNRIAWYCNNWYVRTRKPLLVRFDLGTNFNREIFARDLVAEICLATKKAFRHPPVSPIFGMSLVIRSFGYFGRFCQVNIPWALVASLLTAIFLANADSTSSGQSDGCESFDQGLIKVLEFVSSANLPNCALTIPIFGNWSVREIGILFLGLFGLIAVGIIHGTTMFFMSIWYSVEDALSCVMDRYAAIALLNALILISAIIIVSNILVGWLSGLDRPILPDGMLASYLLNLGMICMSIVLLPRWWRSYVFFDEMLVRCRPTPPRRFADISFFGLAGPLSSFIAQLLPASDSRDHIDSVSEPFVQELTKQTLVECVRNFDRVVILIDDIDALPSEKFHELLRLVRPLGKVPGTRCVLATPLYFHFALKQRNYGDVHSTVRASVVVGNKEIHDKWPNDPTHIADDTQVLSKFLVSLLISRLRVQLRSEDLSKLKDVESAINESPPFRFILRRWVGNDQKKPLERIKVMFSHFGTSRRELIRELGRSIRPETREGVDYKSLVESMSSATCILESLKRDYKHQENILNCDTGNAGTVVHAAKPSGRSKGTRQGGPAARRSSTGTRRRSE